VLISDDDVICRTLMGRLIRGKLGYEALETSDGLSAWNALDSGIAVQLCILDMWMPGLNGVELLSKLRSDSRFHQQKVILCSAENHKSAILKVASLGVSGYLLKPFITEHFLEQVKLACGGKPSATGPSPLKSPAALGRSI